MDTVIYYFTGTGNSLYTARKISDYIHNSKLEPIAQIFEQKEIKSDTKKVGFVFPLYYWGLPKIVEKFIKKINLDSAGYIFYISTSGGESSNDCVSGKIKNILSKKGKKLNGGFRIVMPGNYIKIYDLDSQDLQKKKLANSLIRIKSIADKINNMQERVKKDKNKTFATLVNNYWQANVNKSDKNFFLDESCNSCRICEKICPVKNITLINGKPVWSHKCEECLACIHFCPNGSIKTKSEKVKPKGRYHHPEITSKDIILFNKASG